MTFDEFFEDCWKDLPPIRRGLAGRLSTKRIMLTAMLEWDEKALLECKTAADYQRYEEMILDRVKKQQYGFAIAIFVLMAIASAVIQWITLWWLNHISERGSFEVLRRSLQR